MAFATEGTPVGRTNVHSPSSRQDGPAPVALAPVIATAVASFLLLIAFAGAYGYHRDELYFLVAGRRLAWGFVDQPPITPAIARLADELAEDSLIVLRVFPALFTAVTVVLAALCARELGAGRLGQTATAVVAAGSTGLLAVGHLLSTSTLDVTLWVAITLAVLRILRTRDVRLWPWVGALVGVALLNKWTVGFLVVGLLIGVVAGRERRLFASGWFVAGAAVALAIWSPNLLWQASHGWPQLAVLGAIQERSADPGATALWVPLQLAISGWLATPLWIAGLVRVLRSEEGRRWRALGIAYVALAITLAVVAGDKPYYVAALYLPLAGAGAVPFERWWERNRSRARRVLFPTGLAVLTLLSLPIVLPVLPASTLADVPLQEVNYDLGEQIGWPTFARQVERAWRSIAEEDRARSIILTGSYGEAAALERYALGLPPPHSGHNTYWWWRTPPVDTAIVLAVGLFDHAYLAEFFEEVHPIATIDNGLGVDNEEQGAGIWLCRSPRRSLPDMWRAFRHYN